MPVKWARDQQVTNGQIFSKDWDCLFGKTSKADRRCQRERKEEEVGTCCELLLLGQGVVVFGRWLLRSLNLYPRQEGVNIR